MVHRIKLDHTSLVQLVSSCLAHSSGGRQMARWRDDKPPDGASAREVAEGSLPVEAREVVCVVANNLNSVG